MPSPRRLTSWLTPRPEDLPNERRIHLDELLAACSETTALARLVAAFARLVAACRGNDRGRWAETSTRPASPSPAAAARPRASTPGRS